MTGRSAARHCQTRMWRT